MADGQGDGVCRYAADGVVRSVDWIEHESGVSSALDVTGLLAQDVQRRSFVVEYLQDRFLRDPVDAGARSAIGASAYDFGRIPRHGVDGVLNRVGEFEEKPLHRSTYDLS